MQMFYAANIFRIHVRYYHRHNHQHHYLFYGRMSQRIKHVYDLYGKRIEKMCRKSVTA